MSHKGFLFPCKIVCIVFFHSGIIIPHSCFFPTGELLFRIHNVFFPQGNYYEVGKEDENKTKSWGFCGKDCYLDTDAPDKGILRMKEHIHILSDQLCEKFLNISLEIKPEVAQIKWQKVL